VFKNHKAVVSVFSWVVELLALRYLATFSRIGNEGLLFAWDQRRFWLTWLHRCGALRYGRYGVDAHGEVPISIIAYLQPIRLPFLWACVRKQLDFVDFINQVNSYLELGLKLFELQSCLSQPRFRLAFFRDRSSYLEIELCLLIFDFLTEFLIHHIERRYFIWDFICSIENHRLILFFILDFC
jgi:hypothetical protein